MMGRAKEVCMSTDEQYKEIGKAHQRRKAAHQELQCLTLKAKRLETAIDAVLGILQVGPEIHDAEVMGKLKAYPAQEDVLQTIENIRLLKEEIARLDKLLA